MVENEIREKIEAQKTHCKNEGLPHFAPKDGKCWSCGNQIYKEISIEKATNELITGCPSCHRSYCD